jgi:hypothetical protein
MAAARNLYLFFGLMPIAKYSYIIDLECEIYFINYIHIKIMYETFLYVGDGSDIDNQSIFIWDMMPCSPVGEKGDLLDYRRHIPKDSSTPS